MCPAEFFQLLMVAPGVSVEDIACRVMAHAKHHCKLQLSFTLLQLLVASLGDHRHMRGVNEILAIWTPANKGSPAAHVRQRDLLPLPLPAFGASLKSGRFLKDPMTGLLFWSSDIKKKVRRQQLAQLCVAALPRSGGCSAYSFSMAKQRGGLG